MWQIMVFAGNEFETICEATKKLMPHFHMNKDLAQAKDENDIIIIEIRRFPTENFRGYKPDIIYCDKKIINETVYNEILRPCAIYGAILPLKLFKWKIHINE